MEPRCFMLVLSRNSAQAHIFRKIISHEGANHSTMRRPIPWRCFLWICEHGANDDRLSHRRHPKGESSRVYPCRGQRDQW
eukprot:scaffold5547_cov163-Amphora_coffeaeformis.AAC.3